jgi:RDD family
MAGDMSTTMEAPQAEALPKATPPRDDLSKYDSRRAIARAVDGVFVGAPFLIPILGLGFKLSVAIVAISLLYFFLCEALWGQTLGKRLLGLRVLMRDGRPATAKAVSLRTLTRIVEDGPIGLAVFLASGKRRGRFGDLLGDTIVARPAPGLPRAGLSPLMIAFPAGIAVAAVALVLGFSGHFARQDYLHAVDKTCARNAAAAIASPAHGIDDIVARTAAEHRKLAAVKTPGSARKLRAEILALDAQVDRAVATAGAHVKAGASGDAMRAAAKPVAAARQRAAVRYAELGLRSCAGYGKA